MQTVDVRGQLLWRCQACNTVEPMNPD